MYECEYDMSWLKMLKTLVLVCVNDIRPWMMLTRSFMWNLEPIGKVMILEVENHNSILLLMNYGIEVIWMEQNHMNP